VSTSVMMMMMIDDSRAGLSSKVCTVVGGWVDTDLDAE
jgi:hypothetical protein